APDRSRSGAYVVVGNAVRTGAGRFPRVRTRMPGRSDDCRKHPAVDPQGGTIDRRGLRTREECDDIGDLDRVDESADERGVSDELRFQLLRIDRLGSRDLLDRRLDALRTGGTAD